MINAPSLMMKSPFTLSPTSSLPMRLLAAVGCCLLLTLHFPLLGQTAANPGENTERGLVFLHQQFDTDALKADADYQTANMAERHRLVVEELKALAEETQYSLLKRLRELEARGEVVSCRSYFAANLIAVEAGKSVFDELALHPDVRAIYPDEAIALTPPEIRPQASRLDETGEGLIHIRAREVWDLGFTGYGVLISHIDSGVNADHPALSGRWRGNYGHPSGECWLDMVEPFSPTPVDVSPYHGTMTMGIICGMEPGDTVGVAWGAQFITAAIDLFGAVGLISGGLAAFEWLLEPDGNPGTFDDVPRVISNSWGVLPSESVPCNDVFDEVMDNCEAAGIAVIWAAGNEGASGESSIRIPANRAVTEFNSFSVGAFNQDADTLWSGSSQGPSPCTGDPLLRIKPEVTAPGTGIRSSASGTGYASASGTSFSNAHAAGVLTLMIEANPELPVDSLKEILTLTAVDKGVRGNDNHYGYGCIDAYTAVYASLTGIGWMRGRVTDDFGYGVETVLELPEHPHQFRTDGDGYYLLAMPADLPFVLRIDELGYQLHEETAALLPGDTLLNNITLIHTTSGMLTGTVINCFDVPAPDAWVRAIGSGMPDEPTGPDGSFNVSLLQGTYTVTAWDGYCLNDTLENVQIQAGGVTDIELILEFNPAHLCSGPDVYGYRLCDDTDSGGPRIDWAEVNPDYGGNGTIHNLGTDAAIELALPFEVSFYGQIYHRLFVSVHGIVSFEEGITTRNNTAMPAMLAPGVFALWDDLNDGSDAGGDIVTCYDAGRGEFIVEWSEIRYFNQTGESDSLASFQVALINPAVKVPVSGDAIIEVRYQREDVTDQCTVGLDAADGISYIPYLFDGQYDAAASPLNGPRGLRICTGEVPEGIGSLNVPETWISVPVADEETVESSITIENTGTVPLAYQIDPAPEETMISRATSSVRSLDAGSVDDDGYAWIDSRDAGGPVYDFFDISSLGTDLGIVDDDTTTDPIPLPWQFPFYGRFFDRAAVCANGFLSFTSCASNSWNRRINYEKDPYYMIAPFWDDLGPDEDGAVYLYEDAPNERVIVQWDDVPLYSGAGSYTFQAILYRDGSIEFVYEVMQPDLLHNTIGIKGRDGDEGRQLAYNSAFVENNLLVRFYRPENDSTSCRIKDLAFGVIPPLSTVDVPILLKNAGLGFGSFTQPFSIVSSDTLTGTVPVTVEIQSSPQQIDVELVALPTVSGLQLRWNSVSAPFYCVYSSDSLNGSYLDFEGAVSDTFLTVDFDGSSIRFFEIRLCEGPPLYELRDAENPESHFELSK